MLGWVDLNCGFKVFSVFCRLVVVDIVRVMDFFVGIMKVFELGNNWLNEEILYVVNKFIRISS